MNRRLAVIVLILAAIVAGVIGWRLAHYGGAPSIDASSQVLQRPPSAPMTVPQQTRAEPPTRRVEELAQPLVATPPEIAAPVQPQITMHVRVVDRATNAAIAGAVIVRAVGEGAALESDIDGRCQLTALLSVTRTPQFSQQAGVPQGFCRVRADGFAFAEFHEEEGHESADKALEVKLDKAATLAVGLLHRPLPDAGAYEVRASWQAQDLVQNPGTVSMDLETMHFEAPCDAQGFAVVEKLPASVPVTVAVFQSKTLVRGLSEPLKLEAGARRELEIDLGGACHLTGRVVDSDGVAVPNIAVWLAPKGRNPIWQFENWHEKSSVAKARGDVDGRFDLGEIPAGKFWIGPAPSELYGSQDKFKNVLPKGVYELDFAAMAALVEITADERVKEVDVHIQRGLSLEGIVLDPDGIPMPGTATVMSASTSSHFARATCGPDGKFTIGPLVSESYKLHAYHSGPPGPNRYSDSEEVEAQPGARDVVIRMRRGAEMSLRVVDRPGGTGVRAALTFEYFDDPSRLAFFPKTDEAGAFKWGGNLPGRVSVVASTADGRVGVLPSWTLVEGANEAEIVVEPGAKLIVHQPDASKRVENIWVYRDGVLVGQADVRPDGSAHVVVAPGTLLVRTNMARLPKALEQTVTVAVGEEREVVLGP
ncbi:MAG TPA: carboxypeptidase-like regulatory domain-containing protein [Planctomycetota bacterium]|nr:carboxypeptidase-like regulatory domain-containing protein [Planctomycetota bacterium]